VTGDPNTAGWELTTGHAATVGSVAVRRILPQRRRRTVGAWCFADHMGPAEVTPERSIDVGPHPHIGLQTVTWLTDGEILHRDSLGSVQLVRPGELNLMTAGAGIAHSEEATGSWGGRLQGVQLWVALPDRTRDGPPDFAHHADLPTVSLDRARATVLVGSLAGARSPARADTDHFGAEITLPAGRCEVPVDAAHEHAVVVVDGALTAGPGPGVLGYLPAGPDRIVLTAAAPTRLLLLGGRPWPTPPLMWWNFVARTHEEIDGARQAWERGAPRFAPFASPLARLDAPPLPYRLHVPDAG
jgi:redox-sensitive bicupin YhaK (pirin superfamily)